VNVKDLHNLGRCALARARQAGLAGDESRRLGEQETCAMWLDRWAAARDRAEDRVTVATAGNGPSATATIRAGRVTAVAITCAGGRAGGA